MAAIEGLTIIINGDATPFKRAMREMRAETTSLSAQLASVNKLLAFDPGSTVLLTRRQELLNTQLASTSVQLSRLNKMNETYAARASELTAAQRTQWQSVQRRLTETELQYARLRQQAVQYGAAASSANLQVQASARGLQSTLSTVSNKLLAVSAATALIGALSIKAAVEFEQSFAGVRKTIIATQAEYEKLAASTREIALNKPISVNDVNEIMMYAGQLGVASENLTKFASVMADLDVATDMDLEEGSMQLARFMNICNMSQADVDRLGATIVDLGNNSATTESQIMLMAMRIAGTGSNLGMSAQNILALATALSSVGIQAEMGGNAISTIMNKIDKAVALDQATLTTWAATAGMTTEEFKANWTSNVQDTLVAVIKGMGTFRDEGGNLNVLLQDMGISYMRQIDTMQRLSRAGQLVEDLFVRSNVAWANNTALVREATQRYDTAESKLQMMKNALYDAGITIGQAILPAFKDVVLTVTNVVQAFGSMDEGTRSTIVNIGGVVTATGLLVKALELGAGTVAGVAEKIGSLKTWMVLASEGASKYSKQSIALASSLGAETAAAQANAIATRDAALAKAAAAKAYAEHLRSAGMDAAAAEVDAFAARQNAVAQAADADATALNGAMKLRAAGSSSVFAAAQALLTSQTWALATALGVTNGVLLAYAAAAAAVVAVLVIMGKAADPMNQLTEASKRQKEEVDAAREKYERLSSTLGEHADETVKAKAAYEDLNLEFEENKETLAEMRDRLAGVVSGMHELVDSAREASAEADTNAGRIMNDVDAINALAGASDEASRVQLAGYISDLSNEMGGLDLTTQDVIDNTEYWTAAMYDAQKAADSARWEQAYETFGTMSVAAQEAAKGIEDLKDQYKFLNDEALVNSYIDLINQGMIDLNTMQGQAVVQYMQLKAAADDVNATLAEQESIMRDTMDKTDAYKLAIRYSNDANVELSDAIARVSDMLGYEITEQEVADYQLQQTTKSAQEASEAFDEMVASLDGIVAGNGYLSDLLVQAGATTSGLAQYLSDAGISIDDFESALGDMAEKAGDAFNKIEVDSETNLYTVIETLQSNTDAMRNWGDNMNILWDRYGREGNQLYIDALNELREYGPEHANIVQELVDGDLEVWDWYASTLGENQRQSTETTLEIYGAGAEQLRAQQERATQILYESLEREHNAGMTSIAEAYSGHMDQLVNTSVLRGSQMAETMAAYFGEIGDSTVQVAKHNNDAYTWMSDFTDNLISGLQAWRVYNAVSEIANSISSLLHFSLPDEGPLRDGGGPRVWMADMVDEMIAGMRSREDALSGQSARLAWAMRDPLLGQPGQGYADWAAVGAASASQRRSYSAPLTRISEGFGTMEGQLSKLDDVVAAVNALGESTGRVYLDGKLVGRAVAPLVDYEFAQSARRRSNG